MDIWGGGEFTVRRATCMAAYRHIETDKKAHPRVCSICAGYIYVWCASQKHRHIYIDIYVYMIYIYK